MLFPGEFDFYPPTWFLPEQYHQFVAEVLTKGKGRSDPAPSTTPLPGEKYFVPYENISTLCSLLYSSLATKLKGLKCNKN